LRGLLLRKGGEGRKEGMRGKRRGGRKEERGGEGGEGREKEAFLVMWPRRLSALNPPLTCKSTAMKFST